MKTFFDHEKLDVYRESIDFCGRAGDIIADITARAAVKDQLDRASTSIPLNVAEGNGKFSDRDRARFFEIARGSALECAACLDVMVVRGLVEVNAITAQKEQLSRIVQKLMGMLRKYSGRADFLREDEGSYPGGIEHEQEHEHDYERGAEE